MCSSEAIPAWVIWQESRAVLSTQSPRITEQDAIKIIESYAMWRGTEHNEVFANRFARGFIATEEGSELLSKLNGTDIDVGTIRSTLDEAAYKSMCDNLELMRERAESAERDLERIRNELSTTFMGEPLTEKLPHWEPCNPACDSELGGYRSRSCKCRAAIEAIGEIEIHPERKFVDLRQIVSDGSNAAT